VVRPYVTWYPSREWGVHRSWDVVHWVGGGGKRRVIQVNIGRLGVTIPVRRDRGEG
jgi:hypothetical protein